MVKNKNNGITTLREGIKLSKSMFNKIPSETTCSLLANYIITYFSKRSCQCGITLQIANLENVKVGNTCCKELIIYCLDGHTLNICTNFYDGNHFWGSFYRFDNSFVISASCAVSNKFMDVIKAYGIGIAKKL